MTITRAWWIVAGGMIVALPGAIAVAGVNRLIDLRLRHPAHAVFVVGLAIAAVGIVQVVRTAVRAFR